MAPPAAKFITGGPRALQKHTRPVCSYPTRGAGRFRAWATPLMRGSNHGRAAAPPAAAATGLYPQVAALRIASKPSALDISAVVWQLRREPPAANARAIAAAETLSGISVMSTASYCPNAK